MARPTLENQVRYLTTRQVALALGISQDTLVRRINAGMYPYPTVIKENGLRLFNERWVERARERDVERAHERAQEQAMAKRL